MVKPVYQNRTPVVSVENIFYLPWKCNTLSIKNVKQWHCVDSIGMKVEDEFSHLVLKAAG